MAYWWIIDIFCVNVVNQSSTFVYYLWWTCDQLFTSCAIQNIITLVYWGVSFAFQ